MSKQLYPGIKAGFYVQLRAAVSRAGALVAAFLHDLTKDSLKCVWDSTLPTRLPESVGKVLIAANMYDNEAVAPHFVLQLLKLVARFPRGRIFVSVYESGSKDATGKAAV